MSDSEREKFLNRRKLLDATSAGDSHMMMPLRVATIPLPDEYARIVDVVALALLANFDDEECRCKGALIPGGQYVCRHERAWAAFKLIGVSIEGREELKARLRRGEL